jgi:hypothetical protein
MTLAVEVMMITASTSMKLPNVSWPIESENDRGGGEFGGVSAVMLVGAGSSRAQYTMYFGPWGHAGRWIMPVYTPDFADRGQVRQPRHTWIAPGLSARAKSDGIMPNMSRNALEKCAELAKPAAWAASVSEAPSPLARIAAPIRFQRR